MAIRYALIENKLTPDPNDCRAQVQHNTSIGVEEIAAAIARPGSTVTKAEMLAFWEEFSTEVIRQLMLGNRVVLDLFVASVSVQGVFTSPDDTFDPARHTARIKLTPNTRLRKAEAGLHFEQVRASSSNPVLDHLEDFTTDATDGKLSKGGTARLSGQRLKFDPADAAQGLYFVAANGTATKVAKVKTNTPAELLFVVPATLTAGSYRLEVRAKYKGSDNLRVGPLDGNAVVV